MSGSIAAIAAYDGTGTQGYGTTDKNLPGVKSIFWNENDTDKYYVNGSSFSEVPANKNTITTPETIVFTFDNDSDAVSDLTLLVETPGAFTTTSTCPSWVLAYLIERVEICVGNQVISTITTAGLIHDILRHSNKGINVGIFSQGQMIPLISAYAGAGSFSTAFNLNAINTFNDGLNCSYLMACANNQTLQVKVYPFNLDNNDLNMYTGGTVASTQTTSGDDNYTFRLFCNKSTMTNAERNFLRNQVLPKRTNITQISSRLSVTSLPDLNAATQITIYCDTFNINAEAIYIIAAQVTGINIGIDAELYLNSTSYSGIIPSQIMQQSDELSLTAAEALSNASPSKPSFVCYKIPLGNSGITDQDFVPLNRYDSIRVVITPSNAGNTTGAPRTFSDLVGSGSDLEKSFFETLSVIVEGKCTALYQNGAVTFNNY
jgi:hypothetical protein